MKKHGRDRLDYSDDDSDGADSLIQLHGNKNKKNQVSKNHQLDSPTGVDDNANKSKMFPAKKSLSKPYQESDDEIYLMRGNAAADYSDGDKPSLYGTGNSKEPKTVP